MVDDDSALLPPLRTLGARRHNLPVQLTSFLGRERELAEVQALVRRHRFVTLTGQVTRDRCRIAAPGSQTARLDSRQGRDELCLRRDAPVGRIRRPCGGADLQHRAMARRGTRGGVRGILRPQPHPVFVLCQRVHEQSCWCWCARAA
jgi:hypothetical protein